MHTCAAWGSADQARQAQPLTGTCLHMQTSAAVSTQAGGSSSQDLDPWEWWCQLYTLCEHHSLLGVLLDVPEAAPGPQAMYRWRGQPLKAACVSSTLFTSNKKGFPVLGKAHQELLAEVFATNAQVGCQGGRCCLLWLSSAEEAVASHGLDAPWLQGAAINAAVVVFSCAGAARHLSGWWLG